MLLYLFYGLEFKEHGDILINEQNLNKKQNNICVTVDIIQSNLQELIMD